jgi:hypothetical protein
MDSPQPNPLKAKRKHVVVVGMTGTGKTWYAMFRYFFAQPEGWTKYSKVKYMKEVNVFFDTNNNIVVPEYIKMITHFSKFYPNDVAIAHTVDDFTKFFQEGLHHIIFSPLPTEPTSSYTDKVNQIVEMINNYQSTVPATTREQVFLYFDEISSLCPKHIESPISMCFTRGRVIGICCVAISQRPQMIARYVYDEAKYDIVFQLKIEHYNALRKSYGLEIPANVQMELERIPFNYYIYDGATWTPGLEKHRDLGHRAKTPQRPDLTRKIGGKNNGKLRQ